MASNQFILAASWKKPISTAEFRVRLEEATKYVQRRIAMPVAPRWILQSQAALIVWTVQDEHCAWPAFIERSGAGAAWLGVPYCAGAPEDSVDGFTLATEVTSGLMHPQDVGVPFGVVTLSASGELIVANDVFGAAHLFEFSFDKCAVWSSRPGLAHVFASVVPKLNQAAWQGMASLGWSARGETHLGEGRQIPPLSRRRARFGSVIELGGGRADWIDLVRSEPRIDLDVAAKGMVRTLATTRQWSSKPVSDLSGGKDSRVIAAAAIRAGAVDTVRTVRTDHGEVSTAEVLMSGLAEEVKHVVVDPRSPSKVEGGVLERLSSQHRMWEGYYLARSAFKSSPFVAIRQGRSARLNGLGGEAIQGATMVSESWRSKIRDGGFAAASSRLRGMVRSSPGVTELALEQTEASVLELAGEVHALGLREPQSAVDYVYNFSKMPYWSIPFGSRDVVMPFYSPSLLPLIVHSMSEPSEYGAMHKSILRGLIPDWADVPFYKPSQRTRATAYMWEYDDWSESREVLAEQIDLAESFDPDSIMSILGVVEAGRGEVKHEITLVRALWEISFSHYVSEISDAARRSGERVSAEVGLASNYSED